MNRTYSSADLDTPRDNIDDISSTSTHTLEQDITNVDNSSETSESQSIDITSINFASHHFDHLICNHVLEHVGEDKKAMEECF